MSERLGWCLSRWNEGGGINKQTTTHHTTPEHQNTTTCCVSIESDCSFQTAMYNFDCVLTAWLPTINSVSSGKKTAPVGDRGKKTNIDTIGAPGKNVTQKVFQTVATVRHISPVDQFRALFLCHLLPLAAVGGWHSISRCVTIITLPASLTTATVLIEPLCLHYRPITDKQNWQRRLSVAFSSVFSSWSGADHR